MEYKKGHLVRILLHLIYLGLAGVAGFLGVFLIGVRIIGDNPGALAGGILPFFGTYYFLVFAESIFESHFLLRQSFVKISVSVIMAFIATSVAFQALVSTMLFAPRPTAAWLATGATVFILAETVTSLLLRAGVHFAFQKRTFKTR